MFHIILLVSLFIQLPIHSQHYNVVREQRSVLYALTGSRFQTLQIYSPVSSPLHYNDEYAQPLFIILLLHNKSIDINVHV